jgi:hypothetical protein
MRLGRCVKDNRRISVAAGRQTIRRTALVYPQAMCNKLLITRRTSAEDRVVVGVADAADK